MPADKFEELVAELLSRMTSEEPAPTWAANIATKTDLADMEARLDRLHDSQIDSLGG